MNLGKELRMRRLFRNNRAVIVPIDHPLYNGPLRGLEDPLKLIKIISQSNADGILASPGILQKAKDVIGDLFTILRMDGTHTRLGSHVERISLITTVKQAVKMGVDMGVLNIFCGAENEDELLYKLGMTASACYEWGLPLMGEMIPSITLDHHYGKSNGKAITQDDITDGVKLASRVGAEIGADIIKTNYTGTIESFREVVDTASVPVVVAGGPKTGNDLEFLTMIKDCIDSGAMGICIGRNVWQRDNVPGMLDAICSIVHNSASVDEAVKLL